jgi:preprotein translocase subunit YajC
MKNTVSEKNIVVILFVLVLVIFSFAQRDSKKLEQLYTNTTAETVKKAPVLTASAIHQLAVLP